MSIHTETLYCSSGHSLNKVSLHSNSANGNSLNHTTFEDF
jgi:hypothetical protein